MDEILWCCHSNETSSAVLSHGTIYLLVVLPFESVDEIVCCDHSNETSSAVISPFSLRFLILINFNLLQNSPYFCVFKYARACGTRLKTESETGERR